MHSAVDFLLEGQDKAIINHINELPPVGKQEQREVLTVEEEAKLQYEDNELKAMIKLGKLEIPKVASLGVKFETKGIRKVNNFSELYFVRFQRALLITFDSDGKPFKDKVISLLSEKFNKYALASSEAALLAPRLLDLGLRIKLHDATSLPQVPFQYVRMGSKLKAVIEGNAPGQLKQLESQCVAVGHTGPTETGHSHTPHLASQEGLLLAYQALLFFILQFNTDLSQDAVIATLEPGQIGPLAPIGHELSERHQTILHFARCETLLRLPIHDLGVVEFATVENQDAEVQIGKEEYITVPCLKVRCRNLKTMPQKSHRQLIRLEVRWKTTSGTHHFSTLIGRVLRIHGQDVLLWLPATRANYDDKEDHLTPMNLEENSDFIDVLKIVTDGPEDPSDDLGVRYRDMMRLTRARINEHLVDANGLLGLAFPSLITNNEASLETRQLCRSQSEVFKVSHLPRDDISIDDSQREFITDALTRATSDDTLPNMQRDSFRILIGPPGTGKTSTIAKMISTLAPALEEASIKTYDTYVKLEEEMQAHFKAEQDGKAAAAIKQRFQKQHGHLKDSREAVYVITQSNAAVLNVHRALKDLEVDHALIRSHAYGTFHARHFVNVEEAIDGDDQTIKAILANTEEQMPFVILSTTAMYLTLLKNLFDARKPTMIIIEEASTVSAHLLVSILNRAKGIVRVVLAGDPQQNEPYLSDHEQNMQSALDVIGNKVDSHTLTTCYRLNPAFVSLLHDVAYSSLVSPPGAAGERDISKCASFYDIVQPSNATEAQPDRIENQDDDLISSVRASETKFAAELFVSLSLEKKSVTVICMYEAGRLHISQHLFNHKFSYDAAKLTTVDAFQGCQDETIILVIGRHKKPGFTSKTNRQIVAMTRHTTALHVVTNKDFIDGALAGTPLGVLSEKATWFDVERKPLPMVPSSEVVVSQTNDAEEAHAPQDVQTEEANDIAVACQRSILSLKEEEDYDLEEARQRSLQSLAEEIYRDTHTSEGQGSSSQLKASSDSQVNTRKSFIEVTEDVHVENGKAAEDLLTREREAMLTDFVQKNRLGQYSGANSDAGDDDAEEEQSIIGDDSKISIIMDKLGPDATVKDFNDAVAELKKQHEKKVEERQEPVASPQPKPKVDEHQEFVAPAPRKSQARVESWD